MLLKLRGTANRGAFIRRTHCRLSLAETIKLIRGFVFRKDDSNPEGVKVSIVG